VYYLSERHILTFHQELSEIGPRFDFRVLYPLDAFKTIGFHAGGTDIKLAIKIFHQTFYELCYRRKRFLPGGGFCKTLSCEMNTLVHQKKIYLCIECDHIRGKLERRCGTFDSIVGMADYKYKLFIFHVLLLKFKL